MHDPTLKQTQAIACGIVGDCCRGATTPPMAIQPTLDEAADSSPERATRAEQTQVVTELRQKFSLTSILQVVKLPKSVYYVVKCT